MVRFDYHWEELVANSEEFGRAEKALLKRIDPIVNDLLDEIKANGKIETVYLKTEIQRFTNMILNFVVTSKARNILVDLFAGSTPKWRKFLEAGEQFGFKETYLVQMLLILESTIALFSTELFKLLLLFHMKGVSYDVSKFNATMRNSAPKTWPLLKPFVDNDFRNALAHGTYAILNKKVVLYRDAKLIPFEELKLHEFMMRTKDQNVLFVCLLNLLTAKKKSGFFT